MLAMTPWWCSSLLRMCFCKQWFHTWDIHRARRRAWQVNALATYIYLPCNRRKKDRGKQGIERLDAGDVVMSSPRRAWCVLRHECTSTFSSQNDASTHKEIVLSTTEAETNSWRSYTHQGNRLLRTCIRYGGLSFFIYRRLKFSNYNQKSGHRIDLSLSISHLRDFYCQVSWIHASHTGFDLTNDCACIQQRFWLFTAAAASVIATVNALLNLQPLYRTP
jgi:hypothetical protein